MNFKYAIILSVVVLGMASLPVTAQTAVRSGSRTVTPSRTMTPATPAPAQRATPARRTITSEPVRTKVRTPEPVRGSLINHGTPTPSVSGAQPTPAKRMNPGKPLLRPPVKPPHPPPPLPSGFTPGKRIKPPRPSYPPYWGPRNPNHWRCFYPYPWRCGPFVYSYIQTGTVIEANDNVVDNNVQDNKAVPAVSDVWSICTNIDAVLAFLRNSVEHGQVAGVYSETESQRLYGEINELQESTDRMIAKNRADGDIEYRMWREEIEPLTQKIWFGKGRMMLDKVLELNDNVQPVDGIFENIDYRNYEAARVVFANLNRLMRIVQNPEPDTRELAESIASQYFK